MNTSKGLLHRSRSGAVVGTPHSAANGVPPVPESPVGDDGSPWPTGAKVLVVLLIVATLVATVEAVVGFASGDDDAATITSLRGEIATLTADRELAVSDAAALDAELVALRAQLADVEAENDVLDGSTDDLEARVAVLTDQADALAEQITTVTAARDAAETKVEQLDAALATERQRTAGAIAERDALAALFPMTFDTPFGTDTAVGVYDVSTSQVYCAGLVSCGKAPALADLTVTRASGGNTRFSIPGFAAGDMFWANGAYHAVIDSASVVPACDGVARVARVWLTVFPGTIEVVVNRAPSVVDLQGVISVEAPATATCSGVLAFYSAEFSPHA